MVYGLGRGGDRGGNSLSVQWFGELTNLHSLWDSGLIDNEGLGYSEYSGFLEQEFSGQLPFDGIEGGSSTAAWAQESFDNRMNVYPPINERNPAANLPSLSYDYAAAQNELLKQRLFLGGRRLGQLLGSIFEASN